MPPKANAPQGLLAAAQSAMQNAKEELTEAFSVAGQKVVIASAQVAARAVAARNPAEKKTTAKTHAKVTAVATGKPSSLRPDAKPPPPKKVSGIPPKVPVPNKAGAPTPKEIAMSKAAVSETKVPPAKKPASAPTLIPTVPKAADGTPQPSKVEEVGGPPAKKAVASEASTSGTQASAAEKTISGSPPVPAPPKATDGTPPPSTAEEVGAPPPKEATPEAAQSSAQSGPGEVTASELPAVPASPDAILGVVALCTPEVSRSAKEDGGPPTPSEVEEAKMDTTPEKVDVATAIANASTRIMGGGQSASTQLALEAPKVLTPPVSLLHTSPPPTPTPAANATDPKPKEASSAFAAGEAATVGVRSTYARRELKAFDSLEGAKKTLQPRVWAGRSKGEKYTKPCEAFGSTVIEDLRIAKRETFEKTGTNNVGRLRMDQIKVKHSSRESAIKMLKCDDPKATTSPSLQAAFKSALGPFANFGPLEDFKFESTDPIQKDVTSYLKFITILRPLTNQKHLDEIVSGLNWVVDNKLQDKAAHQYNLALMRMAMMQSFIQERARGTGANPSAKWLALHEQKPYIVMTKSLVDQVRAVEDDDWETKESEIAALMREGQLGGIMFSWCMDIVIQEKKGRIYRENMDTFVEHMIKTGQQVTVGDVTSIRKAVNEELKKLPYFKSTKHRKTMTVRFMGMDVTTAIEGKKHEFDTRLARLLKPASSKAGALAGLPHELRCRGLEEPQATKEDEVAELAVWKHYQNFRETCLADYAKIGHKGSGYTVKWVNPGTQKRWIGEDKTSRLDFGWMLALGTEQGTQYYQGRVITNLPQGDKVYRVSDVIGRLERQFPDSGMCNFFNVAAHTFCTNVSAELYKIQVNTCPDIPKINTDPSLK